MKKSIKYTNLFILYIFIISIILQKGIINVSAAEVQKTEKPLIAVAGQLILKVKDISNKDYEVTLKKYQGKILSANSNIFLLGVDKENMDKTIKELQTNTNTDYVEVNAVAKKQSSTAVDPYLQKEDFLNNSHFQEAWANIPTTSAQVTVAVVDTGIKADHEDLTGKILTGLNILTKTTDTTDNDGHGTQIAGIIAANTNNGIGISGVTGATNTKILPVKVSDIGGTATSFDIATGITYAADYGASIINVSMDGQGYSKVVEDAVNYAAGKKATVVVSAGGNSDYAENYWPANVEGAIVVADGSGSSNFGKGITLAANSSGTTTNNDGKYKDVLGTSYSAAVVSGAVALAKAKFPTYSKNQIENLIKKSTLLNWESYFNSFEKYNHYTGNGYIDALKITNTAVDYIEMVTPKSGDYYNSDVKVNFKAIAPADLAKTEVYINSSATPLTTIATTGSDSYNTVVPAASLVEGSNEIMLKAYSKAGITSTDYRYINMKKGPTTQIAASVLGMSKEKLPKGTKVYLKDLDSHKEVAAATDDNSSVIFYNTKVNTLYDLSYNYNTTVAGLTVPVLFTTRIAGSGSYTADASTLKQRSIVTKKADGTSLTGSVLTLKSNTNNTWSKGLNIDNAFGLTNKALFYAPDSLDITAMVVNEAAGYLYNKNLKNLTGIDSIVLGVDSTVTKVDATNAYDSIITSESLNIHSIDEYGYYNNSTFNIKNTSAYVSNTKTEYYYSATASSNNVNRTIKYTGSHLTHKNSTEMLNLQALNLSATMNTDTDELSLSIKDSSNNKVYLNNSDVFNLAVYDSAGKLVAPSNYVLEQFNVEDNGPNQLKKDIGIKLNDNMATGNYSIIATIDYLPIGKLTSSKVTFANGTATTVTPPAGTFTQATIIVKAPFTVASVINGRYSICNEKNNEIASGYFDYKPSTLGTASFKVDKALISSNNKIHIYSGSSGDNNGGMQFYYVRQLPAALDSTGNINIDNSLGIAKRLTFAIEDTTKFAVLKASNISVKTNAYYQEAINTTIDTKGLSNLWVDDGQYTANSFNSASKYFLAKTFTSSSTSATVTFPTKDLVKFSVKVNNILGFKDSVVGLSDIGGIALTNTDVLYISPALNSSVQGITNEAFDESKGLKYSYSYEFNYDLDKANDVKVLSFDDMTVGYNSYSSSLDLPGDLTASYYITSNGLYLREVYAENMYDFMNVYKPKEVISMELYNSAGTLVNSNNLSNGGYAGTSSASLPISNLPAGNYTTKINVPNAKAITSAAQPVYISINNNQRIRIMDPFDITKPAVFTEVESAGGTYTTDYNGYIYIKKNAIKSATDLRINYTDYNGTAVYYPDTYLTTASDVVISKAIATMKKVTIQPKNSTGNVNIANGFVNMSDGSKSDLYFNLDDAGKLNNLYMSSGKYNIEVTGKCYSLTSSLDLSTSQTAVTIDNGSYATINSDAKAVNPIYLKVSDSNFEMNENLKTIYVSPNSKVDYRYTDEGNGLVYNKSFIAANLVTYNLKIGTSFTATASLNSTVVVPNSRISANLILLDENQNNVRFTSYNTTTEVYANIKQGGTLLSSIKCDISYDGNPEFTLPAISGVVSISYDIKIKGVVKATSNACSLNIDASNFYKITVLDPNKVLANGGTVSLGNMDYEIGDSGICFISKDDINRDYSIVIKGNTKATNELFIYNRIFDPSVLSYSADGNNKKISIITLLNSGVSLDEGEFTIHKDGESYNKLYSRSFNNNLAEYADYNPWSNYNNFNIYMDNGVYNFDMHSSSGYELVNKIDTSKITSVTLDGQKTATVLSSSNNFFLSLNGIYYQYQIPNKMLVSAGTEIDYSDSDYDKGLQFTRKVSAVAGSTINTSLGSKLTIATSLDKKVYGPSDKIQATVDIKDENGNNIIYDGSNSNTTLVAVFKDINGKVVATTDCGENYDNSVNFLVPTEVDGQATVHFEFKVNTLGTFSSSEVPFTLDSSNYYKITINDPYGNPSKGGTVNLNSYPYGQRNISSTGNIFISKDEFQTGTVYNAIINGVCSSTSEKFVYERTIGTTTTSVSKNQDTKLINIKTIKPEDSALSSGSIQIKDKNSQLVYNTSFSVNDLNTNMNIWLDKNAYGISMLLQHYGMDSTTTYDLNANIDTTASSQVVLDGSKVSKLSFVYDGVKTTTSQYVNFYDANLSNSSWVSINDNYYVSKNRYYSFNANITEDVNGTSRNLQFSKNTSIIKDDSTVFHFGKTPYKFMSSDQRGNIKEYVLPAIITKGESLNIYSLNTMDNNGNKIYSMDASTSDLKFNIFQVGSTIPLKIISITNGYSIDTTNIDEGVYDVNITGTAPDGEAVVSKTQKITVSSFENRYQFGIQLKSNYNNYGGIANITFLDGNNIVYKVDNNISSNYSGGSLNAPKSILKTGKAYTALVNIIDNDGKYHYFKTTVNLDVNSSYITLTEPESNVEVAIKGVSNAKVNVLNGVYDIGQFSLASSGTGSVVVQPDVYELSLNGLDTSDGKYYVMDKVMTVGATTTSYSFDTSNLSKLTISAYGKNPCAASYVLQKQGTSVLSTVNYTNMMDNNLYVDKGVYKVDTSLNFEGLSNTITGTYSVDAGNATSILPLGKNLKATATLNKATYVVGDMPSVASVNVTDGSVKLSGFTASDFAIISTDIMHRGKIMKNFVGSIPAYLSGESNLNLNLTNEATGAVAALVTSVNVDNPSNKALTDINIDSITDIYDLVLISKDMDKQKGISTDWDGRCDVDNNDGLNKIDITDMAKVAQNYNKTN